MVSFVYLMFFYLRPKFGQFLRFRPNHSLTAKGFKKRPKSRNLAVNSAKWQLCDTGVLALLGGGIGAFENKDGEFWHDDE